MSDPHQGRPTPESRPAPQPPAARDGQQCRRAGADDSGATTCPACGSTMRLWANYHRCRNCGYKESCCF
jgi:hypothetical protein